MPRRRAAPAIAAYHHLSDAAMPMDPAWREMQTKFETAAAGRVDERAGLRLTGRRRGRAASWVAVGDGDFVVGAGAAVAGGMLVPDDGGMLGSTMPPGASALEEDLPPAQHLQNGPESPISGLWQAVRGPP